MAKIIFQSMNPQLFRAVFIGYLYEIAQIHDVVLLTDAIDSRTKEILGSRNLFPRLKNIVFFQSAFEGEVLAKNNRLCKTLRKAVEEYRPDVVITHTDIWPADMYLLRFAKKAGAKTIAMQAGFKIAGERKLYQWSCLMNAHLKIPRFLPFPLRVFLAKAKKYVGHALYYWILPLAAGELPFPGKTSFVFWDEASGLRDADYVTVFSKRDRDLSIKDGVPPNKIFIIGHPLEHAHTRRFFEEYYFSLEEEKAPVGDKALTLMWPDETIGLCQADYSLIPQEEMRKNRTAVVTLLSEELPDWTIWVKPHPAVRSAAEVREFLGRVPSNVAIAEPAEPADGYIAKSLVVVGVPPPSTTLFSASKHDPNKIVLSLNLSHEFLGDAYKNFEGIEYIEEESKLIEVLESVRNGTYRKSASVLAPHDFSDAGELVAHLLSASV